MKDKPHLGHLPPKYKFILNPYVDVRFTRCPACRATMRQRTVPLLIHVAPHYLNIFVHTCRYCPDCDLLLAHWDQLGWNMENYFRACDQTVIGNDFLIIGTAERKAWDRHLRQPMYIDEMLAHVHDFEKVYRVEGSTGAWTLVDDTATLHAGIQAIVEASIYTLEPPDALNQEVLYG